MKLELESVCFHFMYSISIKNICGKTNIFDSVQEKKKLNIMPIDLICPFFFFCRPQRVSWVMWTFLDFQRQQLTARKTRRKMRTWRELQTHFWVETLSESVWKKIQRTATTMTSVSLTPCRNFSFFKLKAQIVTKRLTHFTFVLSGHYQ